MPDVNKPQLVTFDRLKVSCGQCNLNELCFPHGMNPEDMSKLDTIVEQRKPLHKNDHLYREGDASHAIYAVRSGSVKTLVESPNGDEQIVGFHLPGELLGLDGFMDGSHTCTAIALETTSVCAMPLPKLEGLCTTLPGLQHQMQRIMGKEVTEEHLMLLMLGKMSAEEKIATFLLSISRRMEERHWKATEFVLSMPRQDIANYLGLAVETVSRLFAQYQEAGIIKVDRRRISILQLQRLKEIVGECKPAETKKQG
ncbi:MAG: fumarate/nitrate reduction transcriptional regulator Fnr [Gammaproteobacteria bacterium]|nr:fumarate/nitrate reduction transcriptional regulator Fnr [Gammaproteobacteria bacterium]